jgi:hypothetical protein
MYTVCSLHKIQGHETSDWRECRECREHFADLEMYVGMGTSATNFAEDQWDEAPTFEPTFCKECKRMMNLNVEVHTSFSDEARSKVCTRCRKL